MSTTTGYEGLDRAHDGTEFAVRTARALCLAAGITTLIAAVLVWALLFSPSLIAPARAGALLGAIVFGWSSVSLLAGAVFAAANTAL
ncbi:hypothetical protein [Halalkalicoccus tibetensis]|uniref:Uncharacterized protein n=1 Tax=Halalkalicoccus tibetensis TaxID=175632 RepID=A0ABD5V4A4_9EURY